VCSPLLFASFAPCRLMLVDSITHSRLRFRASCASIVCSPREVASSLPYSDFMPCEIDSSVVCLVCLHRLFTLCRTHSITQSITHSLICVLSSCSCLVCSPREIVLRVLASCIHRLTCCFVLFALLSHSPTMPHSLTHSRAHRLLASLVRSPRACPITIH